MGGRECFSRLIFRTGQVGDHVGDENGIGERLFEKPLAARAAQFSEFAVQAQRNVGNAAQSPQPLVPVFGIGYEPGRRPVARRSQNLRNQAGVPVRARESTTDQGIRPAARITDQHASFDERRFGPGFVVEEAEQWSRFTGFKDGARRRTTR